MSVEAWAGAPGKPSLTPEALSIGKGGQEKEEKRFEGEGCEV